MRYLYSLLVLISILCGCKKNEKPSPPPEVEVTITKTASSINLSGSVKNLTLGSIKKSGFIWGTNPDATVANIGDSFNIEVSVAETITYTLPNTLSSSLTYYVQAYFLDDKGVYHYSPTKSFSGSNTNTPSIQIIYPGANLYTWGDEVPITVYNVTLPDMAYVKLYFSTGPSSPGIPVPIERIEGNKIYFKIPLDMKVLYNVYATIYNQKTNSTGIPMPYPEISNTTEKYINLNSTLTIKGRYFNPTPGFNTVKIGDTPLAIVSGTTTELVVKAVDINMSIRDRLTVKTAEGLSTTTNDEYSLYKYFKRLQDFPGIARPGIMVGLNNKIYYGLGLTAEGGFNPLKDWWKYDPETALWTKMPDCPVHIRSAITFTVGNDIYVGTGVVDGALSNDIYKFNTINNSWSKIAPMPQKLHLQSAAALSNNGYVYLVGGNMVDGYLSNSGEQTGPSKTVFKYDASANKWTTIGNFPAQPTLGSASFNFNGKGYIASGAVIGFRDYRNMWVFDYATEKWSTTKDIVEGVGEVPFSFVINGRAYLGGGAFLNSSMWMPSVFIFEYNPQTDEWQKKDKIVDPVYYGSAAASANNKGYILGGTGTTTGAPSKIFLEVSF